MSAPNLMLGIFRRTRKQNIYYSSLLKFSKCRSGTRSLLSAAYSCDDLWQKRLDNPLLKNIKMKLYFSEVDKKFGTKRKVSGIDIDLFANCVQEDYQLDELEHLLYRFRRTTKSIEMLESTHYAIVKAFLKLGKHESLLKILNDRVNYGVFPNFYCYNLLMDTFLEQRNFRDAAKIATFMMLEENYNNPISCILGLYSCHMFLRECTLESWNPVQKKETEIKGEEEEDDDEELIIRTPYIRNPHFDDHFDLRDPKHLLGKTMHFIGCEIDDIVGRTYQLIGLGMHEKWEKALQLLDKHISNSSKPIFLDEGVSKFKDMLNALPDNETNAREEWMSKVEPKLQLLYSDGNLSSDELHECMLRKLETVRQYEEADIKAQRNLLNEFEEKRNAAFSKQIEDLKKEEKMKLIEEKKKELLIKEKLLFFFENKDKIELELREVEKMEEKYKPKHVDEDYIPPEVQKRF